MTKILPQKTDLLIVGGGIFGASIAYYYKRDNPDKEVIVFERNELCSVNTSLAAALISVLRPYSQTVPLSLETLHVISEMNQIDGISVPLFKNGAIHLAASDSQVRQLEEMMNIATEHEVRWENISPAKARKMVSWLNSSLAKSIVYVQDESYTDPYLLCMAYIQAAKLKGVKFINNCEVLELFKDGNRVTGVRTQSGIYLSEITVLASGVWSSLLAWPIGISLPMAPVRSQYWIATGSSLLFSPDNPTVIIPEAKFYARPQGRSLLFGIRESESVYKDPRLLPNKIEDYVFNNDNGWNDLENNYKEIIPFFPDFEDIGIKNYVAGYSAYTPDNQFILGEVKGIDGLLIATGCSGAGISISGGVGLGISKMAAGHKNPFDFGFFKPDRYGLFDPFCQAHLSSCAAARSAKISG